MPSTHFHNSVCHTTAPRGSRLGGWRAVMPGHHKRRATTSGGLGAPPYGSLFPPPRGVEDAGRCPGIAGAPPPTEETGKAIVWHTEL